jgi:hypothetical protein
LFRTSSFTGTTRYPDDFNSPIVAACFMTFRVFQLSDCKRIAPP